MNTAGTATGHSAGQGSTLTNMDLIDAHIAHIKAGGYSRNTVEDRGILLRRINRELPMGLERATVEELEGWLSRDGWSAQTRATYYGHVRGFFAWAGHPNRPILDWDPSASLVRPRVPLGLPRPVSDAELAQAITQTRPPWRMFVVLAAYAGLRCCELATIDRTDVSERYLIVTGKGGKTRPVPTSPQIWRLVEPLPPGLLAGGRTAEVITRDGNEHLRRRVGRGITWHRFRHWFGTNLLGRGANLRTVQELMGHASPATTAIYTQITDEQRVMAIAALPALAPAST